MSQANHSKPHGYVYHPYPRWVSPAIGGERVLVHNHTHEESVTLIPMNPDGSVAEDPRPKPPTLEEVLAAGYEQKAAELIVAEEEEKAAKGIKPYGDIEPTPPVYVAPQQNPVLDNHHDQREAFEKSESAKSAGPNFSGETVEDPLAASGW